MTFKICYLWFWYTWKSHLGRLKRPCILCAVSWSSWLHWEPRPSLNTANWLRRPSRRPGIEHLKSLNWSMRGEWWSGLSWKYYGNCLHTIFIFSGWATKKEMQYLLSLCLGNKDEANRIQLRIIQIWLNVTDKNILLNEPVKWQHILFFSAQSPENATDLSHQVYFDSYLCSNFEW